ncbi:MAG: hypothetical protein LIP06_15895 [Tannerellaceae bacterium]|nr:hypothetical protein [Tannerellaceae bacterium]
MRTILQSLSGPSGYRINRTGRMAYCFPQGRLHTSAGPAGITRRDRGERPCGSPPLPVRKTTAGCQAIRVL